MRTERKPRSSVYAEKLKDPRWQKRRLEILSRDEWTCQNCSSNTDTLAVHHRFYGPGEPWDAPDEALITLCEGCHEDETSLRKAADSRLVRATARLFFVHEVTQLAEGFEEMLFQFGPGEADLLKFMLRDNESQMFAWRRYMARLVEARTAARSG